MLADYFMALEKVSMGSLYEVCVDLSCPARAR